MGWKNRIEADLKIAEEAVQAVRKEMDKIVGNDERGVDLDEVCRSVIDLQKSSANMMAEIYDSCGPFFQPSKK